MENFIDYYELLHVQPSAPAPVIKASYRALMQKLDLHPDRGGDVELAQLLNLAVTTLCNPQTRVQYDELYRTHGTIGREVCVEKLKRQTSTLSSGEHWGEPGGSPHRVDSVQSDNTAGFSACNEHRRTESPEYAQKSATSRNRCIDKNKSIPSNLTLDKPDSRCLFCNSTLFNSKNDYQNEGNYSSVHRCRRCNGATTPMAKLRTSNNDDLRKLHRLEYKTSARIWTQWPSKIPTESTLYDFSPNGCSVIFMQKLAVDQTVMIDTEMFNAICKVRYTQQAESINIVIGLEFLTLDLQILPGTLFNATA